MINLACPECKSKRIAKDGVVWSGRKKVQRYRCAECGRNFNDTNAEKVQSKVRGQVDL